MLQGNFLLQHANITMV